jgi:hypothetical protein
MQCIRTGGLQPPGQKRNVVKGGCFFQATAGTCFLFAASNIRK